MIKAIIFDLDDTLIKTIEVKVAAHKHFGKKFYNIDLTDEDIKKHWGLPFSIFMKKLYKDIDEPAKVIENYYSLSNAYPTPAHEDALKTIEILSKKFLLGIVTASNKKFAYEEIIFAGFKIKNFFFIQTEEDTKIHKPDPKVFDVILDKLKEKGIKKQELVFVGDHLYDFYAAKGAGINFYGIIDRTTSKKIFNKAGAKTINSLEDLYQIVNR